MLTRLPARLRALSSLALRESATPAGIGLSVGVGVFAACTPFLGFHMWIALAAATALGLNRLWAFLGSRVTFGPLFVLVSFCEIEGGHRVRTGEWIPLTPAEVTQHGWELLTDWLLGTPAVGGVAAASLGFIAYAVARRATISRPRMRASPPLAPSGSPP